MAKDPAFLFYPGDWLGGTMLLTRHQKGCYIDLLMAQFNSGPLSLEHIKAVLGQDQATWTVLQAKFTLDNNGKFYNVKMATEIEKRKNFTASRSNNKSGRKKNKSYDYSHDLHMNNHMENENENRDSSTTKLISINWKNEFFKNFKTGSEIVEMARIQKTTVQALTDRISDFEMKARTEYNSYGEVVDHFRNWVLLNPAKKKGGMVY